MNVQTKKIARIAMVSALLLVAQVSLASLPNTELVTPLLIIYTIVFGAEAFYAAIVFAFLEMLVWGFGLWNIMYFYIWPLLVLAVLLLSKVIKKEKAQIWYAVLAGVYGLAFGALCTIVYLVISPATAFGWWLEGLYFDLWHGICNFLLTLVFYRPFLYAFEWAKKRI